jgi:hypothetical protein
LKKPGDSLVSLNEQGKEVGLESTVHTAFKAIIITDIVGFVIGAIAAIIVAVIS